MSTRQCRVSGKSLMIGKFEYVHRSSINSDEFFSMRRTQIEVFIDEGTVYIWTENEENSLR